MKNICRTCALILALAILATLMGGAALAASPKRVSMKLGVWYSLKTEEKIDKIFKLTLKKDSILTCEARNPQEEEDILEFELFDNKNCDWMGYVGGFGIGGGGGRSTHIIAVSKGTYYLKAYTHSSPAKLKLTSKAVKKPTNTTKGKAATLKKGAPATAIQVPTGPKKLWYKIKLTKKQAITLYIQEDSGYRHPGSVSIYNAKGKKVATAFTDEYLYRTKAKQAAGTYYICVQKPQERKTGQGGYMDMWWQ